MEMLQLIFYCRILQNFGDWTKGGSIQWREKFRSNPSMRQWNKAKAVAVGRRRNECTIEFGSSRV